MATKNNPGKFDCYANAEPDEPMFVLLGRDPAAPEAIFQWASERVRARKNEGGDEQITEAIECAAAMAEYRRKRDAKKQEGDVKDCTHLLAQSLRVAAPPDEDGMVSTVWSWCPDCGALASRGLWTVPRSITAGYMTIALAQRRLDSVSRLRKQEGDAHQDHEHPVQPIVFDKGGVARFKENAIVRHLLDHGGLDLHQLAILPFSDEDRMQFAQLIGYSVCGFGEMDYAAEDVVSEADAKVDAMIRARNQETRADGQTFAEVARSDLGFDHTDEGT